MVQKKVIALYDPAKRLKAELGPVLERDDIAVVEVENKADLATQRADLLMLRAAGAADAAGLSTVPCWVVGDTKEAPRVAGAAAAVAAAGVLLLPAGADVLAGIIGGDATAPEIELARARSLVAVSLVEMTAQSTQPLQALADAFAAHDCVVWWRDGDAMVPSGARVEPSPGYRSFVAAAARISAAFGGVVIGGASKCSVIAEALRGGSSEVAGLVAIVSDTGRRFSPGERRDLKAVTVRLGHELSFLSSHRRLVAEGERLLASSLHDPLTNALTRVAYEQAVTHEVAAATRRNEVLTVVLVDIVALRRINSSMGHKAGDEILAQVATRIRTSVRSTDQIGRIGGDELSVVLVGATDAQAVLVVRKVIRVLTKEPYTINGEAVTIAVRAVLSEVGKGERSGEAAFARCYSQIRQGAIDDATVVPVDSRVDSDELMASGLAVGTVVGGTYRVMHELSRGAMGVVYRGEDLGLGRSVAIKVLRSDLATDRDLVGRFRAEAGTLASLHHPNLVQVYALGEHEGEVYFVMELVEGQPLSELLRGMLDRNEWLPLPAISQVTVEIADALDTMHGQALVHRDVKPANILLDRDRDRAVLVDVGVAAKTGDAREAAGTPGFAAPEAFTANEHSPQSDVYGLAATVYCMLTGRPPYGSGPAVQIIHRQIHEPLILPSQHRPFLSSAIDAVIAKGLDVNPKKRWSSATTFANAMARALERLPEYDSASQIVLPRDTRDPYAPGGPNIELVLGPTAALSDVEQARISEAIPMARMRVPTVQGSVRAMHFKVLRKVLLHHVGESGLSRLVNAHPELASALSPQLAPTAWEELRWLAAILGHAQVLAPKHGVTRLVARGVIGSTFAAILGADPASLSVETVLAAAPVFWQRFHRWGELGIYIDEGHADVMLEGYSGGAAVCELVGFQLQRIVELTGVGTCNVEHTSCMCNGEPSCRFRLGWSASAPAADPAPAANG